MGPAVSGDDGEADGHRLQHRQTEVFVAGGCELHRRRRSQLVDILDPAEKRHGTGHTDGSSHRLERAPFGAVACDDELPALVAEAGTGPGPEREVGALLRLEPLDHNHTVALRQSRRAIVDAVVHDGLARHCSRHELRDRELMMGDTVDHRRSEPATYGATSSLGKVPGHDERTTGSMPRQHRRPLGRRHVSVHDVGRLDPSESADHIVRGRSRDPIHPQGHKMLGHADAIAAHHRQAVPALHQRLGREQDRAFHAGERVRPDGVHDPKYRCIRHQRQTIAAVLCNPVDELLMPTGSRVAPWRRRRSRGGPGGDRSRVWA